MSSEQVSAAIAAIAAGHAALAAADFTAMSIAEVLTAQSELETILNQLPTHSHRIITRLTDAAPAELGHLRLREAMMTRLRIARDEANRRIAEAADLGPRTTLTGQPLHPLLARTAAAQAAGSIGPEHVTLIRKCLKKLPTWIDETTREESEATLAQVATGLDPDHLEEAANQLLAFLDEDGPLPNDTERARRRFVRVGAQGRDGMSKLTGNLDPQARAVYEAIFAKMAARGMANPDDDARLKGTPSQEQIDSDTRSVGQRNHDALTAIGRMALASGKLGKHNGLPVTVIVTTTLQELQSSAGVARTGGGSLLPIKDLIRTATPQHHYLAVFDEHTRQELYLGRARRCATSGQRIMCIARDGGCTRPGCTAGAYHCQVHHLTDWNDGGPPTSTPSPWPAHPTTDPSPTAATPPDAAKTAAPNGSPHPSSTPANPEPTTTTTPTACSKTPTPTPTKPDSAVDRQVAIGTLRHHDPRVPNQAVLVADVSLRAYAGDVAELAGSLDRWMTDNRLAAEPA